MFSSILPVENLHSDAVIQTSLAKPDYLKEGKPSTKIYCFHNMLNQKWRKMQLMAMLVWTPILWLPRCRTYNKIEDRKAYTCYIWQRNGIHSLFWLNKLKTRYSNTLIELYREQLWMDDNKKISKLDLQIDLFTKQSK